MLQEQPSLEKKLGPILGKLVTGAYVLTTSIEGVQQGMICSWVMQAGFAPPALTMAFQHDRSILSDLQVGQSFILNTLGEKQSALMGAFFKASDNPFESLQHSVVEGHGVILNEAVGYLVGQVTRHVVLEDHTLVCALVTDGELIHTELPPWVHIRKNGFSY
jgi:flavin reductase (DIM6/NTAB) family NADH-FMN oxidoreductase RutF